MILGRVNELETTFEVDRKALEQSNVDDYNKRVGDKDKLDGYDCPICKNRGDIAKLFEYPAGCWSMQFTPCQCTKTRKVLRRMIKSGLGSIVHKCTFESYEATDAWQKAIKAAALEYASNPVGWFFIGGQSGAGKTHICTAICRELMFAGKNVDYMLWLDEITEVKDLEKRETMMRRFKDAEVLYIDDLFKPAKDQFGKPTMPTPSDIRLTYQMINYRSLNPELLTIISSEWTQDELLNIDEATGGRIFEQAGAHGFSIAPDRSRNYRTRKAKTV